MNRITDINMDTRDFNGTTAEAADPWKSKDVDDHEARDQRAAEARRVTHEQIAVPAGQAVLRLPEFASFQVPPVKNEAPLKRDREALRRPQKSGLFSKRA